MSPTALFTQRDTQPCGPALLLGGEGVYPGCGMEGGAGWVPEGCYTGTQAHPSQDWLYTVFRV